MPEPAFERNEWSFQALPPLGSPVYLTLIKTAMATDLPHPASGADDLPRRRGLRSTVTRSVTSRDGGDI